jgi:hypothetical protein
MSRNVTNTTLTLGADLGRGAGLRFVGEFARSVVPHSVLAPQGNRGYASLLWTRGHWTPYVGYAFQRSIDTALALYDAVNFNRLPAGFPDAALINALQRAGAEQIIAYDQHSWALGTSFAFSAKHKLKAEIMRTRIGAGSKLVDAAPGGDVRHQDINVLSLSYNVVF